MHKEVIIFILNDSKQILLQKRSANKKSHPNKWAVCSGHVEDFDDSFEAAAVRELDEELKIKATIEELEKLGEKEFIADDGSTHITKYYCLINNEPEDSFILQEEELSEVKWYDINIVIEMMEKKDDSIVFTDRMLEVLKELKTANENR